MTENELKWTTVSRRELLHTPVFDVLGQQERTAAGLEGEYIAIDAPDWVMVIPEYRGSFLLVRQWRHAAECLSLEFPGGVADGGEDPAAAAERELMEETGFKPKSLIRLGVVSPNPALFKNRYHVYLARDLVPTGEQKLDDDELLTYELMKIDDVIDAYGSGEFTHGLMGTALAFYLRWMRKERES